jgi:hypothetical protein
LPATPRLHSVSDMRDQEAIDAELRLVAALRQDARERGGPLPSIDMADALLDERYEMTEWATTRVLNQSF